MFKNLILSLVFALGLAACATTATKMSGLQIGMSKNQVLKLMGQPTSVAAISGSEFLNYNLCVSGCVGTPLLIRRENFYVKLTDGVVESFGNKGDFGTTQAQAIRIEQASKIEHDVNVRQGKDLYTELTKLKALLDSGTITQSEFDAQKEKLLSGQN